MAAIANHVDQSAVEECVKKGLVCLRRMVRGQKPFPNSTHQLKKFGVFLTIDGLEFPSQLLGESRTLCGSRYGNDQVSTAHHGRKDEIAQCRLVGDITKDLPFPGILVDTPVEGIVVGGPNNKKYVCQVIRAIFSVVTGNYPVARKRMYTGPGRNANHGDFGSTGQQAVYFASADSSCTDHQARLIVNVQVDGVISQSLPSIT